MTRIPRVKLEEKILIINHLIQNFSDELMDCIHKGDQHEEFEKCFQKIRDDDNDEDQHGKCATCVCKLFERFPHFNLTAYPSIKDMFCFRGKSN